ncbi:hypothetical protein CLU79DRAFT_725453 [Phycomyces nitens]|nr:hypothetical protein CLU79DRAFT_725453 [Phycomyces nitens]
MFTYDYVFDNHSEQANVYLKSVQPLVEKYVDGFNATILAYGQTGSGKTFSMGTALDEHTTPEHLGIVPRFIDDLFNRLAIKHQQSPEFSSTVLVSFLELYNEDFVDLLNAHTNSSRKRPQTTSEVAIREDVHGNLYWSGVREEVCTNPDQLLDHLTKGSLCRTTGSTDMNSVSSRSHAIFSVILKQQIPEEESGAPGQRSTRTIVSKFHFVDLAGSERLKRTNAQGDRAREGIAINAGLLALGNVISALGDESRKSTHIPYRDSKLTRLLQDSLGGNSQTLMMACVSPSDSNFMETLSTLKYANRARNIKNRVSQNQEFAGASVEVSKLRAQIAKLKQEVTSLRASNPLHSTLLTAISTEGDVRGLRDEVNRLRSRVQEVSDELCHITTERDTLLLERQLSTMPPQEMQTLLDQLNEPLQDSSQPAPISRKEPMAIPLIGQYQKTIQDLRNELADTQERLAFVESARAPMMQALALAGRMTPVIQLSQSVRRTPGPTPTPQMSRRRTVVSSRRRRNGGSTTTRNIAFRPVPVRRSDVPLPPQQAAKLMRESESEDVEEWLNKIIGPFHFSASSDPRTDARSAIDKGRLEIQKGQKMLEKVISLKSKPVQAVQAIQAVQAVQTPETLQVAPAFPQVSAHPLAAPMPPCALATVRDNPSPMCDLMADNELFERLQDEDTMIGFELDRMGSLEDMDTLDWQANLGAQEQQKEKQEMQQQQQYQLHMQQHQQAMTRAQGYMHSRMSSWDTSFSIDSDMVNYGETESQTEPNLNLYRMVNQIKSDIRIKEDLVAQLEKSEAEYEYLRRKFEQKFYSLREELIQIKRERDQALRQPINTNNNGQRDAPGLSVERQQQLEDVRLAYEKKTQKLKVEYDNLKRKFAQTTTSIQEVRNKNESALRTLKAHVEALKIEKKRMIQRMKEDAERSKEQTGAHDREVQQLRRKQARDADAKRQLERENQKMQSVLKKRADEALMTNDKLSQLVQILKKAVREGGVLDERLLTKCAKLLNISSAMIASSTGRLSQHRRTRKSARLPLEVRSAKKKDLLDRALFQFIQSKQSVMEMHQLMSKRNELAEERAKIIADQNQPGSSPIEGMQQFMEERLETIMAEISYLNARIHTLQNDAAYEIMQAEADEEEVVQVDDDIETGEEDQNTTTRQEKRVTFADEVMGLVGTKSTKNGARFIEEPTDDGWLDVDALEERYSLPVSADPEVAHDMAVRLLHSLDAEESERMMECLIDDVVALRMGEYSRQMTVQQLEKTVQDLRRALVVMKKTANKTTKECERKIKKLQNTTTNSRQSSFSFASSRMSAYGSDDFNDDDSGIDLGTEDAYPPPDTIFDRIYNQGIRGNLMSPTAWGEYNTRAESPSANTFDAMMMKPTHSTHPTDQRPSPPGSTASGGQTLGTMAPMKPSHSPLARRRDSMNSPERFLQLMQNTLVTTAEQIQNTQRAEAKAPSMMRQSDFVRYQIDRESSTSSIKSRHVRRSSVQSDTISWSSFGSSGGGAAGLGQPPIITTTTLSNPKPPFPPAPLARSSLINRRRANSCQQLSSLQRQLSLRELSLGNAAGSGVPMGRASTAGGNMDYLNGGGCHQPSPLQQQFGIGRDSPYSQLDSPLDSPAYTPSTPRPASSLFSGPPTPHGGMGHARRLSAGVPFHQQPIQDTLANRSFELKRAETPSVFDRLASGHTRASRAKRSPSSASFHRHSAGSYEELHRRSELDQLADLS